MWPGGRQQQLGSTRCKHNIRWQHLSEIMETQINDGLFGSTKSFLLIKMQQAIFEASATMYKLMELCWLKRHKRKNINLEEATFG